MEQSRPKNKWYITLVQLPFRILFSRFTLALLSLIIQGAIIYFCASFFNRYLLWLFGGTAVFGVILSIYIINHSGNPSFKISWILLILVFPAFGVFIYCFVKLQVGVHQLVKRYQLIQSEIRSYLPPNTSVLTRLKDEDPLVMNYAHYMQNCSGYPIYQNSSVRYYSLGDEMYPDLLKDLEQAKEYIFLEFFIIAKGNMWNSILDILKRKAKEGVLVRVLYDGTCSFMLLPRNYPEELQQFGIECKAFNPVIPVISTHYNNRDHRKLVVIDGRVGYTGGVNLADEYINQEVRFGHWKDTALRVNGEAVRSFVLMFLENWYVDVRAPREYETFLKSVKPVASDSFILPFGDNPFDEYQVGEVTYLHLLQTAKRYVHIIMPYFIVDHEMLSSLCNASRSGVSVILIMPGIPDKPFIYYTARTFYRELITAGVKIYEYRPGFTHAKMFISDDEKAVVGSINMDFRSLYLNFEDAVYLYQDSNISKIENDFQDTLTKCELVTLEDLKKYSFLKTLIGKILRVFAPLL